MAIFGSHNRSRVPATFPDDAACAAYLEKARWSDGFVCPHCQAAGEPFRFANRPGVLRCRKCRRDTGLTVGTVMARSHTPLSVWFWSAYLVSSQTPGVSAVQLRRQLGLSRYETAFQILHKLRAGMVRPGFGSGSAAGPASTSKSMKPGLAAGHRRKAVACHDKVLVASAVEVRQRSGTKLLPSDVRTSSAPGAILLSRLGSLAYAHPCQRFAGTLAGRSGEEVRDKLMEC